jgi:acetyltransferase-like isoleucine patch superfamily enzyme
LDSFVRKAYSKLRGRSLPEDLPPRVLAEFVATKGLEATRGILMNPFARPAFLFRGRNVRLRHRRYLTLGTGVQIGDSVEIDSFGHSGVVLGDHVSIGRDTMIAATGVISEPGEHVRVGDRTAIGAFNVIWGQGGVTIGAHCLLGPYVIIVSENHAMDDSIVPIRDQGHVRAPVVIGDNCWIGAGAKILMGVTIGEGAIIGAGAVVTKDVASMSVVGGVPARIISERHGSAAL